MRRVLVVPLLFTFGCGSHAQPAETAAVPASAPAPSSTSPLVTDVSADASVSASVDASAVDEGTSAAVVNTDAAAASSPLGTGVITMQRSVCFGVCPDYTVTVHEDGLVEYEGRQFVRTKGKRSWHVPVADAQALFTRFAAEKFTTLNVPQSCPMIATDNPTTTTTLWRQGARHIVDHYHGNGCAPKVLDVLEKAVDDTARVKPVIECKPNGYCK